MSDGQQAISLSVEDTVQALRRIDQQLDAARTLRAGLVDKLHRVSASIAELEVQRLTVERARGICPVHKLPHDVLAYLFRLASDDFIAAFTFDVSAKAPDTTHCSAFAFAIAAVCTHWRRIALDCSPLWAKIWFDMSNLRPTNRLREGEMAAWAGYLDTCLDRSRASPLYLYVSAIYPSQGARHETTASRSAMSKIVREAHRWRMCTFITPICGRGLWNLAFYLQSPTPLLERFVLDTRKDVAPPDDPALLPMANVLPFAPNLRELRLPASIGRYTIFSPMKTLEKLMLWDGDLIRSTDWNSIVHFLAQCPTIEEWTVGRTECYQVGDISLLTAPDSKIIMQDLTALYLLEHVTFELLQPLIDALSFPALRHLQLLSYTNTPSCHSLLRAITADNRIETLRVKCFEMVDLTDLFALLQHFPYLETVHIDGFEMEQPDIDMDKDAITGRWEVCPRLRSLTCLNSYPSDGTTVRAWLDLARTRAVRAPVELQETGPQVGELVLLEKIDFGDVTSPQSSVPVWLPIAIDAIIHGSTFVAPI
ncbi:hypothetical protein EXIGLDRAFT_840060 [Exidia glandulosa HHB12029]|uniref:F-box domain-containing protein n=1 Tax=Exidia glandulosa HHB12029 TaxID=1314781 RepID=A0A165ENT5_EXIGL|nr:hypothetical protein EXIGLDRAFT_840060 [Exidia glandulosa HHB12029]